MKRAIVALTAAIGLTVGMTFPMAGIGLTQVTLGCSDGTNVTMTVDTDTLTSLTKSVQALLDYPAGLTCTLAQTPVVRFGNVADAALVPGFVNGGGRFLGSCGPGGGTFWINIAVNAHNQDGNVVGTVNQTIPDGQCIAAGGFTSTPTCLHIFSEGSHARVGDLPGLHDVGLVFPIAGSHCRHLRALLFHRQRQPRPADRVRQDRRDPRGRRPDMRGHCE